MASRPRPRPVPRAKVSGEASSSKTNGPSPVLPVVVDDDAMFMRNQGRSSSAWKKLEKINKPTKAKPVRSDSEGDSDSPRPRKQTKGTGNAQAKIARLLSQELSEESDSDEVQITDAFGTPVKNKRKRRSRSRSLTPPPALGRQQFQQAREVVRRALGQPSRSPSPVLYEADESTDTIIFDPELEKIARAAQANRSHSESAAEFESTDTVEITVKWQPHPLNESGKEWKAAFKLNRTDNFRQLFEAAAEDASILVDNLVMSYNGARLFPSVTPATLKLWDEGELVACDKSTWDYLRANPGATTAAPAIELDLSDTDAPSPVYSNTQESDAESDAGGETFKLVLRSALTTKDITVTVRPTTTCGAIVQAFLKKAGLADKYGKEPRKSIGGASKKGKGKKAVPEPEKDPQLMVDGDKVAHHVPIGDMDLDDGDMVDVVGL
ncbi:hypothetical protein B0H17DRAFT_112446 [Mycena rosella]|uniref:Rad60/SUMO-like domain-containing protein n=1 Tax=Mycena rosella TaxID=1033263 RepID=A0AAD7D413_MYCRO|nr:hypothetical protein B0H17DRAFT_112446 [Mycena rosella]